MICDCGEVGFVGLTRGAVAFFDPIDILTVSGRKWNVALAAGTLRYARCSDAKGKTILMHRAVMQPQSDKWVDHRDFDGLNNRRSNLRVCDPAENSRNRRLHVDALVGFKGVSRLHRGNRFEARICASGRVRRIGIYNTPEEAARAYDREAVREHGAFALTNERLGLLSSEKGGGDD
ncbi:MAG TPA: AP2 domain-containing protein [Hyphomonas sp.]|nr:AP2 domain-containing protein [Hyphomonas sp.]